jgi:enamine deaminase RidA (YjgF/YER057c/UK114 family)
MGAHVRHLNPNRIAAPRGYTHVVEITGPSRMVFISGQLGLDVGGKLVGQANDFRAQATQVFENMKTALAEVGATFADIVKTNNYLTDLSHLPVLREVRAAYLTGANPPASTLVQISSLALPGALLEIEAVVALPAKAPSRPRAAATAPRKVVAKSRQVPSKKRNRK